MDFQTRKEIFSFSPLFHLMSMILNYYYFLSTFFSLHSAFTFYLFSFWNIVISNLSLWLYNIFAMLISSQSRVLYIQKMFHIVNQWVIQRSFYFCSHSLLISKWCYIKYEYIWFLFPLYLNAVVAQPGRALDQKLVFFGVKLKTELSWAQISPAALWSKKKYKI